ncbi:MFS transporter [Actinospica sp. MGRD01-02]|uniref:MFS transporter n=1 Tax=Actinospica acidithermotolerans TaxID=2828514 RepID=A0A941EC20_9ACTN|nr:MFS transporter [Actinospica acidithermotolerans]MBR7827843.1 MFS transporter [Actinospica acidithermotolerans]
MTQTDEPVQAQPGAGAAGEPFPDRVPSLWQNRAFLTFWFGESISLLGTQVTTLALPLTAIDAFHADDREVGVLRFCQLLPYICLALPIGVWTDRMRRRPLMLAANTARLLLLALVPALYRLHALDFALLLVIATTVGIASVLFDLCWMSYVPVLVRSPAMYVEASAKMGVSSSAADVAGPGIAGALIAAMSAPLAILADAASYLVSVVSLLLVRAPEPAPEPSGPRSVTGELRDGLRWVLGDRLLRALALVGACCNFSMVTVWTMFLLYASATLHLGSAEIGGIFASASVGGLLGATISRPVISRFRAGRVYLVAQSALLLGPVLVAAAPAGGPRSLLLGLCVASFFLTYLGLGVAGVIIVSLRQAMTPQAMMGRMTAAFRTLLFGGGALGGLFAGLLSGAVGARTALVVAAGLSAFAVLGLVLSPVNRITAIPGTAPR